MSGVSEIISLREGNVLQLQVGSQNGRPTFQEFRHDEIVSLLASQHKQPRSSRRSKTPATKLSRQIGLLCRAIATGAWSTGAQINRRLTYQQLVELLEAQPNDVVSAITQNAKDVLQLLVEQSEQEPERQELRRRLYQKLNPDIIVR